MMMGETGYCGPQVVDMADATYFALQAVDQSQIKLFASSPVDWAYGMLHPQEADSEAMRFGTAFHAFLLGTARVECMPEGMSLRSNAGKEHYRRLTEQGVIVVNATQMGLLERMRANLAIYPELVQMLAQGMAEHAILWTDAQSGLACKAKPDLMPVSGEYVVDVKTAQHADARLFARKAFDLGYWIQAAFYVDAARACDPADWHRRDMRLDGMEFWAFEKKDACRFARYRIGEGNPLMGLGRTVCRNVLDRIARLVREGEERGLGEGLLAAARHVYGEDLEGRRIMPASPVDAVPLACEPWMEHAAMRLAGDRKTTPSMPVPSSMDGEDEEMAAMLAILASTLEQGA